MVDKRFVLEVDSIGALRRAGRRPSAIGHDDGDVEEWAWTTVSETR